MLLNLHVKNLALIDEAEVEFEKGLNILSGETGAGKSIILGSINLALGGKAGADIIGKYGESALVELTFGVDSPQVCEKLNNMDIYPEKGIITVTRRIMPGRSIIKVNGETVTASLVKQVTGLLIDIHGQHEHQSLLYKSKHLEILDRYGASELKEPKEQLKKAYKEYTEAKKRLEEFTIDEDERNRNISFLQYEIEEIENAALQPMEDEAVEQNYRRMINGKKLVGIVSEAKYLVDSSAEACASECVSRACQALNQGVQYDDRLRELAEQLADIEGLINDFGRDLGDYADELTYDEAEFFNTEKRLDLINGIKAKYGRTLEDIENYKQNAIEKLKFYEDYDEAFVKAKNTVDKAYKNAVNLCKIISDIRKRAAGELAVLMKKALLELNFSQVEFEINITHLKDITSGGADEAEFMISLNPGENLKPLVKIASGGELSRIMLGIKSVLAAKDDTDTLIFDEIDTGISGRTAQKVSEKMMGIAKNHQIICITHLPQIAAMADTHFLIEKNVDNDTTSTIIRKISPDEIIEELSRMLGGTQITDLVRENARQMKQLATDSKK